MAVNEPIPKAQPEGEVCLCCHNSLATTNIFTTDSLGYAFCT